MRKPSKSHSSAGRQRYAVIYPLAFLEASVRLKRSELQILLVLVIRVPFGNRGTMTIRDLEIITGRCRSVLYRHLKSLEDQEFIRWKSGDWTINPNFFYKGSLAFRGGILEAWNTGKGPGRATPCPVAEERNCPRHGGTLETGVNIDVKTFVEVGQSA